MKTYYNSGSGMATGMKKGGKAKKKSGGSRSKT